MLAVPEHWEHYCPGPAKDEQYIARRYSYSDRIRLLLGRISRSTPRCSTLLGQSVQPRVIPEPMLERVSTRAV